MKSSWIIIFVAAVLHCNPAASEIQGKYHYEPSAEKYFISGLKHFQNRQYDPAFEIFDSLMNKRPVHQRTTASYLMAGKTLQKLKRFKASILVLTDFLSRYAQSAYRADALFSLAVDYLNLQRNRETAVALLNCIETPADSLLDERSERLLNDLIGRYFQPGDLEDLLDEAKSERMKAFINLKLAEKHYQLGDADEARDLLDVENKKEAKPFYADRFQRLREEIDSNESYKIGVLLPLSSTAEGGAIEYIARDLLDGIEFAYDERGREGKLTGRVLLEVKDTEKNYSKAALEFRRFAKDPGTLAVIGSLTSDETARISKEAKNFDLPLLSPTATATGISSPGSPVFQMNPDHEIRGKLLALYLVKRMKISTIAVLSSEGPAGKANAETFMREAEKLGAKIVEVQYYPTGSTDLSEQFYNIRKSGLKLQGSKMPEENLSVPVHSIQALYMAISDADEIGMLSSQINYFNIRALLVGSNEWYVPGVLEANKRYLEGVTFISDSFYDETDMSSREFSARFAGAKKKAPSRYAMIGYDACRVVLDQIASGSVTRGAMEKSLRRLDAYRGINRKISFGERGVNDEMFILGFIDGEIRKIEEISFSKLN